jgi:hypothetical protein
MEAIMIPKPTPSIKRMEKLAIEIRDLINKFQERENTYNDSEVITSVLKVSAPYIINYTNEAIEKCEDLNESFYINILDNYMEMAAYGMEDYWGDENEH